MTWNGVSGASSYQVFRSSDGGAYAQIASVTASPYTDSSVAASKTYLYKVNATVNSVPTPYSNIDLATTIVFTNDNSLSGRSIAAVYLQEIRTAVNAVRAAASLGALTFSNPATANSPVQANDITTLRTGLAAAYNALGLTPAAFTDAVTSQFVIKGLHVQEIRNATK